MTDGKIIPESLRVGQLLKIAVTAVLVNNKWPISKEIGRNLIGGHPSLQPDSPAVPDINVEPNPKRTADKNKQLQRCFDHDYANLGYTSRPLNGIWATAPYLHNGSVPSLYDLLLPPAERPKSFYLGTREYDPDKVGFRQDKDAPGNWFEFKTHAGGYVIDGNWNTGHDYNNSSFSPEDRKAIVSYLKTL